MAILDAKDRGAPIDPVSNFLIRIARSTWLSQDILFADYNHEQTTKGLPFRSHLINRSCSGVARSFPAGMRRKGRPEEKEGHNRKDLLHSMTQ